MDKPTPSNALVAPTPDGSPQDSPHASSSKRGIHRLEEAQPLLDLARHVGRVWSSWSGPLLRNAGWVGKAARAGRVAGHVVAAADLAELAYRAYHAPSPRARNHAYGQLTVGIAVTLGTYAGGWWGRAAWMAGVAAHEYLRAAPIDADASSASR